MKSLITLGAATAVLGGGLRVATTFVPYAPHSAWLEALYAVADIGMLFGLIGVYLAVADQVGRLGLGAFAVALTGVASIVGPDATEFGVDFFQLGSAVFVLGLAGMAVLMLRGGVLKVAAGFWLLSALAAIVGAAAAMPIAIAMAGFGVGAGFLAAGLGVLQPLRAHTHPSLQPG